MKPDNLVIGSKIINVHSEKTGIVTKIFDGCNVTIVAEMDNTEFPSVFALQDVALASKYPNSRF